ncbi:MAG: hypothetical protein CL897_02705 [Dehalococcoidia bacterium]|nr:hypothetical protein [Dehalococcoidia bacterium]HCV00176.1 hypothetical protein [Dehalococcoidia bacterium]|tara:strand:+ start:1662 stop:2552 length:891 start_codon:yes stop_codon:yes gene_type:complete
MWEPGSVSDFLPPDASALLSAWSDRVRRNREQVEHRRLALRKGGDFYAPVSSFFRADPYRDGDATLDALRALIRPGETVLDIGAGGGRYALPLARHAGEVIALEPSEGMREVLREGIEEYQIDNIRVVEASWPYDHPLRADVALICHVGYDIEAFGPFLEAMEETAERLCVAVMLSRPPPVRADPFWEAIYGEPREPLPALSEFLALQLSRGRLCEVSFVEHGGIAYQTEEDILHFLRQQLWISEGTSLDEQLRKIVPQHVHMEGGGIEFNADVGVLGIVSWVPPQQTANESGRTS